MGNMVLRSRSGYRSCSSVGRGRLPKLMIILFLVLSFYLPSPCSAKRSPINPSSFFPFTTVIKSLSIVRPTIVINVDDLQKSSDMKNHDDFLSYLKLLPTIEQGKVSDLKIVVLSRKNQWKLHLNKVVMDINRSAPSGHNTRCQVKGSFDLQYPAFKTSGIVSLTWDSDAGPGMFKGRGELNIAGKSAGRRYTLSMPILMDEKLVCKPQIFLDGHSFAAADLQVILPAGDQPLWKVICSGEIANLLPLTAMLRSGEPSVPQGGQLSYRLSLAGKKGFLRPPYDAELKLQVNKLQLQSETGDVAIENAGFSLDAGISVPQKGPGSLSMRSTIHGGPFLWHSFFWDLSRRNVEGSFTFLLPFHNGFPALDSLVTFSGRIDAAPVWKGSLAGSWSPEKGRVSFFGQPMDLAQTIHELMPEFMDEKPQFFKDLRTRGRYQLSVTMEKQRKRIAITAGKMSLSKGSIISNAYQIDGLDMSAPLAGWVWDTSTGTLRVSRQVSPLILKFSSIRSPYLQAEAQTVPLEWGAGGEKISMPKELRIIALGCPVTISGFTFHHPLVAAQRRAELRLTIEPASGDHHGPDLPLSAKIIDLIREVRQHVHADLSLSLAGDRLDVLGNVHFSLFSGLVTLGNMRVRRLSSPSRVLGFDIDARKLDLQKVTSLIQAGSATGIIDMSLKNFELSYGQPSKFDLEIRSVKTKGVPQKISVEAIENLSLLSSGSNAGHGLLNVGINRFFSHYRYAEIGLYCRLRDDAFQLRGLIHQGGREYVVKRGFLTGVDVVNYNPDNQISFRDMQERVMRIFNKK